MPFLFIVKQNMNTKLKVPTYFKDTSINIIAIGYYAMWLTLLPPKKGLALP